MTRRLSRWLRHRIGQGADRGGSVLRAGRADRGATAIEFVFLTPVLFFMIFGAVQFALYSFSETVAKAAAQAGARTARAEADVNDGWREEASDTAHAYLDELGRGMFDGDPKVFPELVDANTVRVRVEAEAPSIFPGIDLRVSASSEGPIERFVEDTG